MMRQRFKDIFLRVPLLRELWGLFRQWEVHNDYLSRREHYEKIIKERGVVYCEEETVKAIRDRLRDRGYTPKLRKLGRIHTFAFVPVFSWHKHLLPDFGELGPWTLFDYVSHGFTMEEFYSTGRKGLERRQDMNKLFLSNLRAAHQSNPVDWVFVYAQGAEISAGTIQAITEEFGIPTVNMCLDDKNCWIVPWMGDHPACQIALAPVFDISWTSSRVALNWYLAEGGRPIYMPEGFDSSFYKPMPVNQDIQVSFIGGAYGFRPSLIRYLVRHDIPIQTFGYGWLKSKWIENSAEVFNRSRINLGMGGIGYSENLTTVKARDFEIPGTGGGVYLTSFNADLAQHFSIGKEILCYRNRYELIELIRYYLQNPIESQTIAQRAFDRCLNDHRWLHRYLRLLKILCILE
jgi:hypothetical protein